MQFEYDKITWMTRRIDEIEYRFNNVVSYSLVELLNDINYTGGWELVGEVQGEIIVRRLITD